MKSSALLNKLRESSGPELDAELRAAKDELHKLKMQLAAKQLTNPNRIRQVRKNIARILTVMSERQAAAQRGKA